MLFFPKPLRIYQVDLILLIPMYIDSALTPRLLDYYSSANLVIPTDGVYKTATYSTNTATTRSTLAPQAATPSPTVTPSPAVTPTATATPTPSSGLSSGAVQAAIVIGAAGGVLALVGLAIFFWMRRRKTLQRRSTDTDIPLRHNEYYGVPWKEEPATVNGYKGELPADAGVQRQELSGENEPKRQTHEMQG